MKLNEALVVCKPDEFITREKWQKKGISMTLLTSAKSIELLDVTLTDESLHADDWLITREVS